MGRVFIPTDETFPRTADAVVIGGGIVGVATAFWLSRAGLDTVLLEMRDGLSTLTTPNSIESFRAQFTEPAMSALVRPSIEFFENFSQAVGIPGYDISLHHGGYLFVTDDSDMVDSVKRAVETHHRLGVTDSEFLTGDEVRARFPYISEAAVAASFRQRDGWFSTHEATQGLAKGSRARFLLRTKVTGVLTDAQGVCGVETTRGNIATRSVVNAAGPFAGAVGRMAGLELPLEPVRRQKVFVAPNPVIPQDAPLVIDLACDSYWRPETGGAYIAWVDPDEPVAESPAEDVPTDWDFPAVVLEKLIPLTPFWNEIAGGLKRPIFSPARGITSIPPTSSRSSGRCPTCPAFT